MIVKCWNASGKGIWGLLKLAGLIAKTVLYNWMLKPLGKSGL